MEREVFELVNKERGKKGLSTLRFSSELSLVARKHSRDMAAHENLSHLSSSGKTYTDRLVEERFFFKKNGENVARSGTFVAELIHQGFMKSPGHRENILNPEFDELGVGISLSDNKEYFVTQDFILSLIPKEEKEVRNEIKEKINDLRKESSLPPLSFLAEADDYARRFSLSKAEAKPAPLLPDHFKGSLILYNSTPSVEDVYPKYRKKILDKIYESAGLGVCFLRNEKNPGGSYFITLIIFLENKYKSWSVETLREVVFTNINKIRKEAGLSLFEQEKEMTAQAEEIVKEIFDQRKNLSELASDLPGTAILYFVTEDPTLLPRGTKEKIEQKLINFKNIGIGVLFRKNSEFRRGAFWVAILLKEKIE